ncbi:PREDICTED: homeobox protein prospero isoform X2 [Nicrophorus vespilloides]|uniref:Homeobox protein prospero isoform X2 n=1 Tax=Nicrophorus vespilloides TaxID=110193 RepID=A0ABM1N1I8_NICVS|nr:PREDICTED: homeobox protein prospero isoform X2 [Nicrophorus vespilloides]
MMSSEEETEFGLYTDKLLKKTKRTRQRVDAGEPRNSYSSIPNFSSRPTFLGNGNNLYGAIFTQQQQFGLFGPGFAPAKMLNELLGRQKPENGGGGGGVGAGGGESDEVNKFDSVIRCDSSPPSGDQLAHHMLRDILQGRKHEFLALEHDLRNGQDHISNNNNNNEPKAESDRSDVVDAAMKDCLAEAGERQQAELMEEALNGMETESLPSPKVEPSSPAKPEDAKKARVENIVSGMRSSPAPPQVNGCKKRKLYQPQQHDSTADRYIDDEEEEEPIRQKRVEKNALKSQLRTMQEQLAEMQQKYVQLCTRMDQGSEESQEVEEMPSDSEQSKRSPPPSPVPTVATTPTASAATPATSMVNHQQTPTLAQQVSKLKISPPGRSFHNGLHHPHPHHNHHPHHLHPENHPHNSISNAAAAMYLGVSHKLMMEQEARMAKEAAAASLAESAQMQHSQMPPGMGCPKPSEHISERLSMMRNMSTPTGTDLEGLADVLKTEITASLSNLIDSIVTRFLHQRRCKNHDAAASAEQLNKDLLMASQMLDRKSPRTKVAERPQAPPPPPSIVAAANNQMVNGNGPCHPMMPAHHMNNIQKPTDLHIRPPMFQPPKPPGISQAALYAMNHPFCVSKQENPEQNEALSLVVAPKKKRHKVTDTRITPRTVSRILGQDVGGGGAVSMGMSPASMEANTCPSPRPPPYHQPPPMLPVSLPTSVAIPNPGLHESQVFSPYSPFFHGPSHGHHMAMQASSSPPRMHKIERDSPPIHHPPTLLHPALLAAAQHGGSPDYGHIRGPNGPNGMDNGDRNSDCNSGDISYDGMQPTVHFQLYSKHFPLTPVNSSTLTPMHLRKAKLMFFWVRYPSSAVLKMYFPDIKFNKNNTAQLVKWFSNFREFYYIQMEKYARQAVSEGVKNADDLHVGGDSELYRVLNLHYNRNNHIEVPSNFRFVVEQTLREFFKAIQEGRDSEQSWKKSIYKIISRLDDPVPEYFKSPNFLEQLE